MFPVLILLLDAQKNLLGKLNVGKSKEILEVFYVLAGRADG
ncbi:hypothetical protein MCC93_20870 [Morococcus cerebrosus]|jgi:hypothetical protein|uniref:Uncharacterized protein n=1 Tax=Morococcus cerebrosus TaxID=1056807 RepID=A0A0C1GLZ3_9NEIS|nr:hypothetical protein MCC93_20870 [Morococcus cerebrosus]